jgi:formylglycine-generating enzyme required for sulfatase activity
MPFEPFWGWHDSHPIVDVNWFDAVAFAEFVGLVLPIEEEWEKAARGVDGRIFPWGNEWDADKCCNGALQTSPVGSFASGTSPYGVYDMSGNVCEWCDSWAVEGEDRIRRGGCWIHESSDFFRTFIKFYDNPSIRYEDNGIRCIMR